MKSFVIDAGNPNILMELISKKNIGKAETKGLEFGTKFHLH